MKNNKLKNWSAGIFHFVFGQIVYCLEQAKEANLKESQRVFHYLKMTNNFCIML